MVLRGQYEHSLDSKDRLTIPARFRAALADGMVLSAGLDPCVEAYPTSEYERFQEQVLAELNPLSRHGRMMRRRFHGRSIPAWRIISNGAATIRRWNSWRAPRRRRRISRDSPNRHGD